MFDTSKKIVLILSVARLGSLVVRDVSPTLEPGRLVTMLGPNGAGKTTPPEALAGMLGFASDRATLHGSDLGWLPGPPGLPDTLHRAYLGTGLL